MTRLYQVDAFSDKPFAGNPAGVCLVENVDNELWMQQIAAEMNLAETAFVCPNGNDGFRIRWFTPEAEVDLCGHATLATARVLFESKMVAENGVCRFHSKSGLLTARRNRGLIELDFPATTVVEGPVPKGVLDALGASPTFGGRSKHDWFVVVASAREVRGLTPDFAGLRLAGVRGVIVTARDESGEYDFVSRFFAPGIGINEDPVTGAAHCALGPWWQKTIGKSLFRAWQASKRGGELEVEVQEDRVLLRGKSVIVFSADLYS
jgi:PhzF family phenazine biosynthesis protein